MGRRSGPRVRYGQARGSGLGLIVCLRRTAVCRLRPLMSAHRGWCGAGSANRVSGSVSRFRHSYNHDAPPESDCDLDLTPHGSWPRLKTVIQLSAFLLTVAVPWTG